VTGVESRKKESEKEKKEEGKIGAVEKRKENRKKLIKHQGMMEKRE
jgi:hypothetical protein